mmetsp:Transcript_40575/g.102140  ORF Transcript_40575/g.102140 Transcript_40575/m.102140 type:complete len:211 (-) Transcript_40575:1894-2526(-)
MMLWRVRLAVGLRRLEKKWKEMYVEVMWMLEASMANMSADLMPRCRRSVRMVRRRSEIGSARESVVMYATRVSCSRPVNRGVCGRLRRVRSSPVTRFVQSPKRQLYICLSPVRYFLREPSFGKMVVRYVIKLAKCGRKSDSVRVHQLSGGVSCAQYFVQCGQTLAYMRSESMMMEREGSGMCARRTLRSRRKPCATGGCGVEGRPGVCDV